MSWIIDPSHSQVTFSARHMMITNVRGRFENFSGAIDFNEENPVLSYVNVQIDVASINTNDPKRDGHLKSPDFFDVEQYPTITFASKEIKVKDAESAQIVGDLTVRDVTREVTLDVEYLGKAKSPWGTTNAGFSASTTINRRDWGLNWNVALETGGWLVGDKISINIELEIIKQVEAQAEAAQA